MLTKQLTTLARKFSPRSRTRKPFQMCVLKMPPMTDYVVARRLTFDGNQFEDGCNLADETTDDSNKKVQAKIEDKEAIPYVSSRCHLLCFCEFDCFALTW